MSEKIRRVDHIGIAVTDLDEAITLYTKLFGCGPDSIEDVPDQKVLDAGVVNAPVLDLPGGALKLPL